MCSRERCFACLFISVHQTVGSRQGSMGISPQKKLNAEVFADFQSAKLLHQKPPIDGKASFSTLQSFFLSLINSNKPTSRRFITFLIFASVHS